MSVYLPAPSLLVTVGWGCLVPGAEAVGPFGGSPEAREGWTGPVPRTDLLDPLHIGGTLGQGRPSELPALPFCTLEPVPLAHGLLCCPLEKLVGRH